MIYNAKSTNRTVLKTSKISGADTFN